MSGNLTTTDIQLIAGLINDKYDDLAIHVSNEIRMVKLTVQDNHKVSLDTNEKATKTNGRVNRLDNEMFGTLDAHGNILHGKEGVIHDLEKVKEWHWLYSNWKVPLAITVAMCAVFIKESRDYMLEGLKFIKSL